jgi:excisionase family DNA binding protein
LSVEPGDEEPSGSDRQEADATDPAEADGGDEIMTVLEAAEFLRVGKNAVYDLCTRGEIPHRRVGRSIRLSRSALLAWLGAPGRGRLEPWTLQSREEGQ